MHGTPIPLTRKFHRFTQISTESQQLRTDNCHFRHGFTGWTRIFNREPATDNHQPLFNHEGREEREASPSADYADLRRFRTENRQPTTDYRQLSSPPNHQSSIINHQYPFAFLRFNIGSPVRVPARPMLTDRCKVLMDWPALEELMGKLVSVAPQTAIATRVWSATAAALDSFQCGL